MKATVHYDEQQRVIGLVVKAEDNKDTKVLLDIAEVFRKYSVPRMKVKITEPLKTEPSGKEPGIVSLKDRGK